VILLVKKWFDPSVRRIRVLARGFSRWVIGVRSPLSTLAASVGSGALAHWVYERFTYASATILCSHYFIIA